MAQMSFTKPQLARYKLSDRCCSPELLRYCGTPLSFHFSWILFLGNVKGSRLLPRRALKTAGEAGKFLTPMSQCGLRTAQGSTKSLRHCPHVAIKTFYPCVYTHEDGR